MKEKTQILQKQNVGNAGEYFIASRLSALDYTVTITLGRAERYDILALSPKGKLIKISVKTTQLENSKRFPLSQKDEEGGSDDFYYAFVKLNNFEKLFFYLENRKKKKSIVMKVVSISGLLLPL